MAEDGYSQPYVWVCGTVQMLLYCRYFYTYCESRWRSGRLDAPIVHVEYSHIGPPPAAASQQTSSSSAAPFELATGGSLTPAWARRTESDP